MCDHVTMSEASVDVGVDGAMVPVRKSTIQPQRLLLSRDLLPVMVDG